VPGLRPKGKAWMVSVAGVTLMFNDAVSHTVFAETAAVTASGLGLVLVTGRDCEIGRLPFISAEKAAVAVDIVSSAVAPIFKFTFSVALGTPGALTVTVPAWLPGAKAATTLAAKLTAKAPGVCRLAGVTTNQFPPLAVAARMEAVGTPPLELLTRIVRALGMA